MGKKIRDVSYRDGHKRVSFKCPGCGYSHTLAYDTTPPDEHKWGFNGDYEKPTFTPSILYRIFIDPNDPIVCHSFVTDGKIQFLDDCKHDKKSTTVELDDIIEGEL